MNTIDAIKQLRDKLEEDGFPPVENTGSLIIRKDLLQALYKLWEVDNVDDLFLAMAKYNAEHIHDSP